MLSIVVPAYNEEAMILKAADVFDDICSANGIPYELIMVDDGSSDGTYCKMMEAAANNPRVVGIRFSRNFGKEAAIIAGLTEAKGDCCVVIDCDLQHPPEKIVEMYKLWQEGYEVVEGRKASRGTENPWHAWAAKGFYALISAATGFDMENASDFKLLDRKAVDVLINMHERNAFFRALSSWIGFKTAYVTFHTKEREAGESKWSTFSLVKYALRNISSFSAIPMQIVTVLGVMMLVVSMILGGISFGQKVVGKALEGFTTVILITLFSSSIIMISLGIIGYYIARIYEEIKGRPRYIISEKSGKCCSDKC